ncbi:MAG: hypothetical protein HQL47_11825, partial [Gammaproteobacteria bacterium]|nr:hypothetical protein [Gammaproteobacteria bacterium]
MPATALRNSLFACLLLAFAGLAQAYEISGRYSASGSNPGGKGGYEGMATIQRKGDVYEVEWR